MRKVGAVGEAVKGPLKTREMVNRDLAITWAEELLVAVTVLMRLIVRTSLVDVECCFVCSPPLLRICGTLHSRRHSLLAAAQALHDATELSSFWIASSSRLGLPRGRLPEWKPERENYLLELIQLQACES